MWKDWSFVSSETEGKRLKAGKRMWKFKLELHVLFWLAQRLCIAQDLIKTDRFTMYQQSLINKPVLFKVIENNRTIFHSNKSGYQSISSKSRLHCVNNIQFQNQVLNKFPGSLFTHFLQNTTHAALNDRAIDYNRRSSLIWCGDKFPQVSIVGLLDFKMLWSVICR